MKNLPTDLLRTFVTVADLGAVTPAGELLGRSQPAISLQLKRLESLVETPLFNRQGQQMALSDNGRLLYDTARQILTLNDEVLNRLSTSSLSGRIRFRHSQ